MEVFDDTRPCGSDVRGSDRYTRAELVRLAARAGLPTVGRTMDEICADLRQAAAAARRRQTPGRELPATAQVRSGKMGTERCPPGYTFYRGYERRTPSGMVQISPTCRRKTSVYAGSRRQWEERQLQAREKRAKAAQQYFKDQPVPTCDKDEILVRGYYQPTTGRFVQSYCRKDTGLPGKGLPAGERPVLLKADRLSPHGYAILPQRLAKMWNLDRAPGKRQAEELRHRALLAAIDDETKKLAKEAGYSKQRAKSLVALSISRRLQALARFTRNTRPDHADLFAADAQWIREQPFYLAGKL